MSKFRTETTRKYKDKGFWDKEKQKVINEKDGEETDPVDILNRLGDDGQLIEISVVQKDFIESIDEDIE